jgi:uncharacterized protein (TIGR03437 family)
VLNQDGSVNASGNAAARGSVIALFGTGTGGRAVSVWIDGIEAEIRYAGPAPGLAPGVVQVNAVVPLGSRTGPEVLVAIASDGQSSQPGVTMAVR